MLGYGDDDDDDGDDYDWDDLTKPPCKLPSSSHQLSSGGDKEVERCVGAAPCPIPPQPIPEVAPPSP